jgi:hypothetical protein
VKPYDDESELEADLGFSMEFLAKELSESRKSSREELASRGMSTEDERSAARRRRKLSKRFDPILARVSRHSQEPESQEVGGGEEEPSEPGELSGKSQKIIKSLRDLMKKWHQLSVGDLTKPDSWGKTADGRTVLIDFGLTTKLASSKYYQGHSVQRLKDIEKQVKDFDAQQAEKAKRTAELLAQARAAAEFGKSKKPDDETTKPTRVLRARSADEKTKK